MLRANHHFDVCSVSREMKSTEKLQEEEWMKRLEDYPLILPFGALFQPGLSKWIELILLQDKLHVECPSRTNATLIASEHNNAVTPFHGVAGQGGTVSGGPGLGPWHSDRRIRGGPMVHHRIRANSGYVLSGIALYREIGIALQGTKIAHGDIFGCRP